MGFCEVRPDFHTMPQPASPELLDDHYLLAALFNNTSDRVYFKDRESRFVQINRKQAEFLHLVDPSDAIGKTDRDFFGDRHAANALKDEREIIHSGRPMLDKEEREDWPDGRVTWASTSKMPLFNAAGECIGTLGISRDITGRHCTQLELLEIEARFRDLTNAIREVFWILDVQSEKMLYVSPAYEEIWGMSSQQLYVNAKELLCEIHEEDRAKVEATLFARHYQPFESTFRLARPDGDIRWIRSRGFPIRSADGSMLRLAGLSADITVQRQARDAYGKTERLLASIVNSSPDAIVSQSLDGKITTWNPSAERIFGYSAAEAIGSSTQALVGADSSAILDHIRQGHSVNDLKLERRHKNGNLINVSLTASPIRDESGEIVGASGQYQNISERKMLEDKLFAVSEQLRALLEATNEYVIALDFDWHITYQNHTRNGGDLSNVVGTNLWEHAPYLAGTCFEQEARRAMRERKPCRFEEYIASWKAWMTGVAYPTETGLLILAQDETEKRALDSQLRSAQKMEAIGQLAAGIAHEINTPIQYVGDNACFLKESWGQVAEVLSAAQQLRSEAATGQVEPTTIHRFDTCCKQADVEYLINEVPRAIDQTLDGVQRVAKIVGAMKEFSHPGLQEKRAIDLNRAIETTITISRNEWKYLADVRTDLDPNLPLVPCLAGEMNQVFLNLVVNAAHAIADVVKSGDGRRGTITLSTRRVGDCVEIAIADTGTGIPEPFREKVFDPFFTTKDVGKGTGQGLMLAQTVVVKKHGGRIWFDSEVGRGTTFFVSLPLLAADGN